MREELVELLEEAFETGIVTSIIQSQIDSLKKSLKISESEYHQLEDKIRLEAYLRKVKEREKKGVTFFGDLRKQYKITEEDKEFIQEKLKSETKKTSAPKSAAPVTSAPPAAPKKTTGNKIRVLLADDNETHLQLTKLIIEEGGYECVTVETPEQAIAAAVSQGPAIIFCDINFGIGKPTGMDVFTNLRMKKINTPFVIVSAFIQKEFKDHAKRIGITDYITKPIDPGTIFAMMKKYIPV